MGIINEARGAVAGAAFEIAKSYGLQCAHYRRGEHPDGESKTLYCVPDGDSGDDYSALGGAGGHTRSATILIPKQAGWDSATLKVRDMIRYPLTGGADYFVQGVSTDEIGDIFKVELGDEERLPD